MSFLRLNIVFLALLLASCANHEGQYEPDCIAFEGDKIVLRDGRFEWHRFTDQRTVDEEGNVVDPFPGFPRSGTYKRSGARLDFDASDGTQIDYWFVVEHAGQRYLLNPKQHNAFVDSGDMPRCALKLSADGS